ncbi:GNAT family N-acetyltransferase [Prevotella pallens]|uniref:GNAT family N-acetyltransferase n=1 Tax=Prevotella pallens TaxID=60133 RepID=UPI003C7A9EEA
MKVRVVSARLEQSAIIAEMIMEAMNHECCQWFAGPQHTIDDFFNLMKKLVERTDSQYSYLNTLVAITPEEEVIGVCVSYDGSLLRMLRKAFIEGAKAAFGRDFSDMPDETAAGELYIDSLCVSKEHRGKGIAKLLLCATIEKGKRMNLPTGLLVDTNNPKAEALYNAVGFVYKDDNQWGGHAMRHMVYTL